MKVRFLVVRRVPPVRSPVLAEVYGILEGRGFAVEETIAEEMVEEADGLRPEHDLYVLKSHTELSLSIAGVLHAEGARLLNPYASCVATQNKIVASRRLRAAGVPVPRTWVTGELELLRPLVRERALIIKPYLGHRGVGVRLVEDEAALHEVPAPEGTFVAQEYIRGTGEDLKVYVVGDEVFAVRKPFSAESFAVPGTPCAVTREIREIALRCGRAFGLGLYGLDVIESPAGPFVVDLNFFPGYKGVPGAAAHIAAYVERYAVGRARLGLAAAPEPPRRDPRSARRRSAPAGDHLPLPVALAS